MHLIYYINAANQDFYRPYYYYRYWRIYFNSGFGIGDERCVSLIIYDDTRIENDEYFYFNVSSGSRTRVIPDQRSMTINILENDHGAN